MGRFQNVKKVSGGSNRASALSLLKEMSSLNAIIIIKFDTLINIKQIYTIESFVGSLLFDYITSSLTIVW